MGDDREALVFLFLFRICDLETDSDRVAALISVGRDHGKRIAAVGITSGVPTYRLTITVAEEIVRCVLFGVSFLLRADKYEHDAFDIITCDYRFYRDPLT